VSSPRPRQPTIIKKQMMRFRGEPPVLWFCDFAQRVECLVVIPLKKTPLAHGRYHGELERVVHNLRVRPFGKNGQS